MAKLTTGDYVIVKMYALFEKSKIAKKEKDILILENGIRFSRKTMVATNSKAEILPYSEDEYQKLEAYYGVPVLIKELSSLIDKSRDNDEIMARAYKSLKRLKERLK